MHPQAEQLGGEVLKHFGKYPGLVLDNGPPDGAAHRGEVLVQLSGLLEEDPSDPTGATQRQMEVIAKPCLPPGFFFVPEPGDRVWVEFAAGVIDEPLWSGVWYPNDQSPQTPDGDAPTEFQKVIRTKKEHVVLLDNTDGKERVVVLDGANQNRITCDSTGLVLEDANGNKVTMGPDGIALEDRNQNKLTMSSSGIVLESAGKKKVEVGATAVKVSDGVGGTQPVALAPLLDWLASHQHVGNMGAPTPLLPPLILQITPPLSLTLVSGI